MGCRTKRPGRRLPSRHVFDKPRLAVVDRGAVNAILAGAGSAYASAACLKGFPETIEDENLSGGNAVADASKNVHISMEHKLN